MYVRIMAYCLTTPNMPKGFTGIYFAKCSEGGIWYWVRKLEHAHQFKSVDITQPTGDARSVVDQFPVTPVGAIQGFVEIPEGFFKGQTT